MAIYLIGCDNPPSSEAYGYRSFYRARQEISFRNVRKVVDAVPLIAAQAKSIGSRGGSILSFPVVQKFAPRMRYDQESIEKRDAVVEHLREFLRLNYMSVAEAARRVGVTDGSLYSWLQRESRPAKPKRITAFLDSLPADRLGIPPTGYQYREYKNWRGIPKPRRSPFCKQAKGEIRRVRGGFQGICRIAELPGRGVRVMMWR